METKLEGKSTALVASRSRLVLLPVNTVSTPPKRGEPVAVSLRSGHIVKVGRNFDEEAFAASSPSSRAAVVLGPPPSVRIYFATALVDMRNGVDELRAIVEQVLVGEVDAGMSITGLYTLVATCEARGINPFAVTCRSFVARARCTAAHIRSLRFASRDALTSPSIFSRSPSRTRSSMFSNAVSSSALIACAR